MREFAATPPATAIFLYPSSAAAAIVRGTSDSLTAPQSDAASPRAVERLAGLLAVVGQDW